MEAREFYNGVIDYVEQTQGIINDLQKPAFSDDVLQKTAETLVGAKLLSEESAEVLMQSFRDNPDKALESLQKVAAERKPAPQPVTEMIGSPANIQKESKQVSKADEVRESDQKFLEGFGLI